MYTKYRFNPLWFSAYTRMCFLLVATLRARKLLYLGVLQEAMQGGHAENPYLRDKLKRVHKLSWNRKMTDLKPEARCKTDLKPEAVVHKQTWNRKLWRLEAGSCSTQTDRILEVVLLKHTGNQKLWFTHWPEPEALMNEQTWHRKLHCTNTLETGSVCSHTGLNRKLWCTNRLDTGTCGETWNWTFFCCIDRQLCLTSVKKVVLALSNKESRFNKNLNRV